MSDAGDGAVGVVIGRFEDLLERGIRGVVEDEPSLALRASDVPWERLPAVLAQTAAAVAIADAAAPRLPSDVQELVRALPACRLVLIAERMSAAESAQLLRFGASACIARSAQRRDLVGAIHLAGRGMQLSPLQFAAPSAPRALLTARESEVLERLQAGRSNAQIASELHVSVETVRTHVRSIFRKLGVSSRRELSRHRRPQPARS